MEYSLEGMQFNVFQKYHTHVNNCFLRFNRNYIVSRIGDGAAKTRKFSYYKLDFGISKRVKLAIPPHFCKYDVMRLCFYPNITGKSLPTIPSSFTETVPILKANGISFPAPKAV